MMRPINTSGTNVFAEHSDYFGLNADKQSRNAHVLCMSNPEVVRLCTEAALKYFEDNPESLSYGLAPADGSPACFCENCRKENGDLTTESQWSGKPIPCISGTYYKLMNQVAKEVGKKYPDKVISVSIYAGRIMPPPNYYRFEPNIGGHLALIEYTLMHPIDDPTNWQSAQIRSLFQSWRTRVTKLVYRPYYPSFMVHCGLPIPLLKLDTISEGMAAQWYAPDKDLADWSDIMIGRPLELQGYYTDKDRLLPYLGEAWYAGDIDLPPKNAAKELGLLVGGINNEAWIWINGVLAGYQPFHTWWMRPAYTWICEIPPEAVKSGKNRVTVRVVAGDRFGFGGIFRGMFFFEPGPKPAVSEGAAAGK